MAFSLRFNEQKIQAICEQIVITEPLSDEFLNTIGEELVNIAHEAFENEESPLGETWQELSERYTSIPKDKGGPGFGILKRSLDLFHSISYEIRDGSLFIGSNMRYAAVHQFGYEDKGIPARPYIGFTSDFEDRVLTDPAILELL